LREAEADGTPQAAGLRDRRVDCPHSVFGLSLLSGRRRIMTTVGPGRIPPRRAARDWERKSANGPSLFRLGEAEDDTWQSWLESTARLPSKQAVTTKELDDHIDKLEAVLRKIQRDTIYRIDYDDIERVLSERPGAR